MPAAYPMPSQQRKRGERRRRALLITLAVATTRPTRAPKRHSSSHFASAAKADRVVRDQTIADREDGAVDITYAVADQREFVRWALRWGTEAEILAPADVRAEVRDLIARLSERYAAVTRGGVKPRPLGRGYKPPSC